MSDRADEMWMRVRRMGGEIVHQKNLKRRLVAENAPAADVAKVDEVIQTMKMSAGRIRAHLKRGIY